MSIRVFTSKSEFFLNFTKSIKEDNTIRRKNAAEQAVREYYTSSKTQKSGSELSERASAVRRVLEKTEHMNPRKRQDYDTIFRAVYRSKYRNINAVSMEIYLSPSYIYRCMNEFYAKVEREMLKNLPGAN